MSEGREELLADWIETPVGSMIAVANRSHVHLLEFHDRNALPSELRRLQQRTRSTIGMGRTPAIDHMDEELEAYFAGRLQAFETPLAPDGTAFEQQVWGELRKIPFGETRSYAEVARAIGSVSAVRAVARANATNRIAIVIPCHRVIGSDGSLTGYAGGLERKQWLLRHEGRIRPVGLFEGRI